MEWISSKEEIHCLHAPYIKQQSNFKKNTKKKKKKKHVIANLNYCGEIKINAHFFWIPHKTSKYTVVSESKACG